MESKWVLIEGGNVIDGAANPVHGDCSVLIEDNRIAKIGEEASRENVPRGSDLKVIDARGKTVMPGMIDGHVHLTYGESRTEEEIDLYTSPELRTLLAARNVTKVLQAGVTSISQPGGSYYIGVGIREGISRGLLQGPRMTSAGRYLTTSNGLTDWYPDSVGVPAGNIGVLTNTVDQMREEIRRQVKNGVDLIKLSDSAYGEFQAFANDEMKSVADLAHQLGRKLTIHARGSDEVGAAVNAGFDWIMHGNMMTDEVVEKLAVSRIPLVPTLLLLANLVDFAEVGRVPAAAIDGCKRLLDRSAESLHRAHSAGVKFAVGTDTGFAVAPYGEWHGRELELLHVYAGLSPLEAIQAGTSHGAVMVNLDGEVGEIAVGKLADVLVVSGDPSIDLGVLSDPDNIEVVILNGVIQEFEEGLRHQRFHSDRLPNQYSWETVTHHLVETGELPSTSPVSWSSGDRADVVAQTRHLQQTEASLAAEAVEDGHLGS
jgi:imidazolonepropionase-like amidohydrolase